MTSCTHSTSVQWGLAYPPLMSILSAMMFLMTVSSASFTSSLLLPLSAFLSFLSRPSDLAISVAWILEGDFRLEMTVLSDLYLGMADRHLMASL